MARFDQARELLRQFKGDRYLHGLGVLPGTGAATAGLGRRAALVCDLFPGAETHVQVLEASLRDAGVEVLARVPGAAPNAPREDLARITVELTALDPEVVVGFGGGSTLDAVKAAGVLRSLGGGIEEYFGVGLVSKALAAGGRPLTPFVAVQTAASSGAHLTKYSNITDLSTGQKKLIVDEAVVPVQPVFDYEVTFDAPASLTADGALDGISHALEVLYDAHGKPSFEQMERVAGEAIGLVIEHLPTAIERPRDPEAREGLGLATDLGGYAIMLGGTNGAHLTSFSLVDILSHGRACAIMNPYYTVFFAPAIERPLRLVGSIYARAGYLQGDVERLSGRELGMAVARAMIAFERRIGNPSTLGEVPGFTQAHVDRALAAAKIPQLRMKLENMPVRLTAETVDEYMGPVLEAARTGDLELIRNVP
ncbi:MAG: iron-containing alcohol dehydrogenase [Candidatus Latescibacterota bacterium]|jgi:alcohol dehydrogenase class IV